MSYYVRTDGGTLTAKVDNVIAGRIMREVPGHWQQKKFVDGRTVNVYIVDQDVNYGPDGLKIYMFKGYYLIKIGD